MAGTRHGMRKPAIEHEEVLCVDADVLLYETFLDDLTRSMQQHPIFIMARDHSIRCWHDGVMLLQCAGGIC